MQCEGCQGLLEHCKLQSDGPFHSSPGLVKSYHEQPILQQSTQYNLPRSCRKKRKDYAFRRQCNEKPSIITGCPGPRSCTQPTESLKALHVMRAMGNVMQKCFVKRSSGRISTMCHVLFGLLHKPSVNLRVATCCFGVVCVLQKSCTFSWHS